MCVNPPPVPVTVTTYVPVAVEVPTVNVRVELPEPGAAMDDGLKPPWSRSADPEALSAMAELKPPETASW